VISRQITAPPPAITAHRAVIRVIGIVTAETALDEAA
jgi:hypothetical protein